MTLWDVQLPRWTGGNFRTAKPDEVLVEFDGLLTFRDDAGSLMLAHLLAADAGRWRYAVVPTTEAIMEQLRTGARSIRGALDQPIAWMIDVDENSAVTDAWAAGTLAALPGWTLPADDVMLYRHLEPLIRARATGQGIGIGSVPADAVKTLVSGVQAAIRALSEYVEKTIGALGGGFAPGLALRQLRLASIEIAFEPTRADDNPSSFDPGDRRVAEVERLLAMGLRWARSPDQPMGAQSPDEEMAVLEAIRNIAPKRSGDATRVEVTGRVVQRIGGDRPTLTNITRARASELIRAIQNTRPEPVAVILIGFVRVHDSDRLKFVLRNFEFVGEPPANLGQLDALHGDEVRFDFDPDQLDEVMDAAYFGYRVHVIGETYLGANSARLEYMRVVHSRPEGEAR